ncbi:MAG: flagellar biosynthesis protein FlhF [Deltaproteobacteria bacterium]|nr:flagellar biosynthesis protein FlhF [Deltaproteobacteria bacterium]
MPVKHFEAPDMQTALLRVKKELGSEAVILSAREKNGSNGRKSWVEITASLEHSSQRHESQTGENGGKAIPADELALTWMNDELFQIKEMLLDLTHRSRLSERVRDRKDLLNIFNELIDSELSPALARGLIDRIVNAENGKNSDPYDTLHKTLCSLLKVSDPFRSEIRREYPKILALIGPSGAGKTLTAAKLAAQLTLKKYEKVALVSLDGYRLGAAEQLRKYSEIIGLPFMACQDKKEFKQAVELFKRTDIILVDTPGQVLSSAEHMRELHETITVTGESKMLLVLSATTKDRKLTESIHSARNMEVESVIVSKVDETDRYGNVINNLIRFKLPVSFLTNGRKVPDDILAATPGRLAGLVTRPKEGV